MSDNTAFRETELEKQDGIETWTNPATGETADFVAFPVRRDKTGAYHMPTTVVIPTWLNGRYAEMDITYTPKMWETQPRRDVSILYRARKRVRLVQLWPVLFMLVMADALLGVFVWLRRGM